MKPLSSILLLIACLVIFPSQAQTPYDAFAPETSRPMLGLDAISPVSSERPTAVESMSDSATYAIVIDQEQQSVYLLNLAERTLLAAAPLTDDVLKWLSVDPLSDKYPNISPYAYCGWNPIGNVDLHGDSVSFAGIRDSNIGDHIITDLQTITGLSLSSEGGMLIYKKNESGEPIILSKNSSETARNQLISIINNTQTIDVKTDSYSKGGGMEIYLSSSQINKFIEGAHGVDNRTLGYGMTFLHESFHTQIGGDLRDNYSTTNITGDVVNKMNVIRQELNIAGYNFGQRITYAAYDGDDGIHYLPFNNETYLNFSTGILPTASTGVMYISF